MTTMARWGKLPPERAVAIGRFLLLAVLVSMLLSTSVAIGLEFASYVAFAVLPELRRRLALNLRHPLMIGFIVFAIPIVAGAFYGAATWYDSLTAVFGWRRALLLPLALAVFDDEPSKRLVIKTILIVSVIGAVASFLSAGGMYAAGVSSVGKWQSGIIFRNYTTQGLTLTIAMIIALAALLRPDMFAGDRLLGNRAAMAASIVVVVLDIVYILEGRSAYLSVLVMGVVIVVLLTRGSWRLKLALGVAILAVLGVLLVSSSQTRQRVAKALQRNRNRRRQRRSQLAVDRRPRRLLAQHRADDCRPSGIRRRHRRLSGRLSSLCRGRRRLARGRDRRPAQPVPEIPGRTGDHRPGRRPVLDFPRRDLSRPGSVPPAGDRHPGRMVRDQPCKRSFFDVCRGTDAVLLPGRHAGGPGKVEK